MSSNSVNVLEEIKKHFDLKTEEISLNQSLQLATLSGQVKSNSESIVEIRKAIARLEQGKSNAGIVASKKILETEAKEEKYLCSRRSGRFWSIEGNEDELKEKAVIFLTEILGIATDEKIQDRIETVSYTHLTLPTIYSV